ncbi:MAG TPA: carboxypeptidase-like regulatory domain-containing protein, partial [Pyrinomonadaceae bacterium]|nr:carboxypeptidase-like regulatory domain-containing protein [Pyrinomonadaceae bacterium]
MIDSFRFGVLQVSISQIFIVVMIWRKPNALARLAFVAGLMMVVAAAALGQKRGTINGTITPPTSSVVVIATDQVTSRVARAPVKSDGTYSLNIRPGAYRLTVAGPYVAKFDKGKNYGEHALIRDDS